MILEIFSGVSDAQFRNILRIGVPAIILLWTLIAYLIRRAKANFDNKREQNSNNDKATRNIAKQTVIKPNRNTIPIGETRKITIGRDPNNQLVLSDSSVSRFHLELIIISNYSVEVIDKNSTNGTYINGVKKTSYYLQSGDKLRAGNVYVDWEQFQCIESPPIRKEINKIPIQNGTEVLAKVQFSFWVALISLIIGFIIAFIALGGGIFAIIIGSVCILRFVLSAGYLYYDHYL